MKTIKGTTLIVLVLALMAISIDCRSPNPPTPTPPPPPPGVLGSTKPFPNSGGGLDGPFEKNQGQVGDAARAVAGGTVWIYDTNCRNDRPPFGNGRWIQVDRNSCPAVITDPTLRRHDSFCLVGGSLVDVYPGEETWVYDNGFHYCLSLPYLLCPALNYCEPDPIRGQFTFN